MFRIRIRLKGIVLLTLTPRPPRHASPPHPPPALPRVAAGCRADGLRVGAGRGAAHRHSTHNRKTSHRNVVERKGKKVVTLFFYLFFFKFCAGYDYYFFYLELFNVFPVTFFPSPFFFLDILVVAFFVSLIVYTGLT